jgi:hypothetical protein
VLDDALGSASEDLIAVLALHLLAVAFLALGDAVDVMILTHPLKWEPGNLYHCLKEGKQ